MSTLALFEEKQVRRAWNKAEEKWYFAIVDVIAILTGSDNPQVYWRVMKKRLSDEGNETVANCNGLKMTATDGKQRLTDVADTKALLRLIQSTSSPKAGPFKLWLAKVGYERLEEIENPELAAKRKQKSVRSGPAQIRRQIFRPVIPDRPPLRQQRLKLPTPQSRQLRCTPQRNQPRLVAVRRQFSFHPSTDSLLGSSKLGSDLVGDGKCESHNPTTLPEASARCNLRQGYIKKAIQAGEWCRNATAPATPLLLLQRGRPHWIAALDLTPTRPHSSFSSYSFSS